MWVYTFSNVCLILFITLIIIVLAEHVTSTLSGPDLILLYDPSLNIMKEYGLDVIVQHVTDSLSRPDLSFLHDLSHNMSVHRCTVEYVLMFNLYRCLSIF